MAVSSLDELTSELLSCDPVVGVSFILDSFFYTGFVKSNQATTHRYSILLQPLNPAGKRYRSLLFFKLMKYLIWIVCLAN